MLTSDVSDPYETIKRPILKRGGLTGRQGLNRLLNNIELQHISATDMLQGTREVIGQITFDDGLFKQLSLSKLPQQMQAVLVSFQNNAVDELAASAGRILEITKSSNVEVFSVKEKPQATPNDITELCQTLTRYLRFRNDRKRPHTPRSISRRRSVSRPRETDNLTVAGIITSMESLPGIAENRAIFQSQDQPTRKRIRETSKSARVNGKSSRET
ncbi:unnamed protein product [Schistosoma mattheei]|uniref:Uncharacterized protein n=1 Tax=Schistosoma mattheei TaxID=31246 RepID=A0A183NPK0_9TREM|nr:unnamed protein product [Schistosoma mattheei]